MTNAREEDRANRRRSFAVTSLGKDRWYWVVWPSVEEVQSGHEAPTVAFGHERTKAAAVDQALRRVGADGVWLAAKYGALYHRTVSGRDRSRAQGFAASAPTPAALEFLYQDIQDDSGDCYSVPHRIARKTKEYVYVEQMPHDAERLMASRTDQGVRTFRLSRKMLEQEGYALVPIGANVDEPVFFNTPFQERVTRFSGRPPACLTRLGLSYPCTAAEVKGAYRRLAMLAHPDHGGSKGEFQALQAAYEQALRLCRE